MTLAPVAPDATLERPTARWTPVRDADRTLVEQLVDHLARQIDEHVLRAGTRLPSIRDMAQQMGVSRFTVVEAYDRLAAQGAIASRRGAGFFVQSRAPASSDGGPYLAAPEPMAPQRMDIPWLLRSMFGSTVQPGMPGGAGLLPAAWMDGDMVMAAVRAVGRTAGASVLHYGAPQGYAPLRQQIAAALRQEDVPAHADRNILTTAGVTHALTLIVRHFVRPGDTVLVEDPGWCVVYGQLQAAGANVVGVPRRAEGPDLEVLEAKAARHRPKLFIINTPVHNPTGLALTAGNAHAILRLAERYDFTVVEDDTYGELHPGGAVHLAAMDGLRRVVRVGGFSKMMAPSLRVGYLAAAPELTRALTDEKLLSGLTTPEMGERIVHRVLVDGPYRRYVERVRARVNAARDTCVARLLELGFTLPFEPRAGMFVWADCGMDGEALARAGSARQLLLAPGSLYSPSQAPSPYMRFTVSMAEHPAVWRTLAQVMADARGGVSPNGRK